MSRARLIAVAVVLLLAAAIAALILLRGAGPESADASPTASVTTATVRSEALQDVASVYGVVQADPSATSTLAAPRPLAVTRVFVRPGQAVSAGQALAEVASSPAAELGYLQAVDAATAARSDLARVQRLFDERLAAADQLSLARKTLTDAEAALAAQQKEGAGRPLQLMSAPQASIVTSVAAAPGDHVAQDAPLFVLARDGAVSVRLGLEPSAGVFAVGDVVNIRPLTGGAPIASRLILVARAADPVAKTLDGVAPLAGARLPIGAGVQADIVTGSHQGLAVPRAAVVFDETGDHLFIIAQGKARRVFVTVGRDYGDQVEVRGPIAAGQAVAVQGAYELQDGMAVKVDGQ